MDSILRRAWAAIYNGIDESLETLSNNFVRKYGKHTYIRATPFEVPRVTGSDLAYTCRHAKNASASGMDQWGAKDFNLLSSVALDLHADMFMSIESGAAWPLDMLHARVSHLSKDPANLFDPLAYRVLMLMSIAYRRWASTMLPHLRPWIA